MVTEKRLIDANEPIAAFKRYAKEHPNATWGAFGIEEVLNACSTMDAAPVVHGRWINVRDGWGVCSNCRRVDEIHKLATHCRFCGAKMDGGMTNEVD